MEEDIKILEEEIKRVHKINDLSGTYVPINILENLLKRYKELEEENKTLTDEYMIQKHLINADFLKEYIPLSIIHNKINELKEEKLNYDNNFRIYTLQDTFEFQEKVLQEILEEGNK